MTNDRKVRVTFWGKEQSGVLYYNGADITRKTFWKVVNKL